MDDTASMNMSAFFAELRQRGIRIQLDDSGALRVKGKKEQLDQALVSQLKANKTAIFEYLKHPSELTAEIAPELAPDMAPDPAPEPTSQPQINGAIAPSSALPLEQQKLLAAELNPTALEENRLQAFGFLTLHGLVEAQVVEHPNKIAVEFNDGLLSYAQLNQQANRLAAFLRHEGLQAEALVGVCMTPSTRLIVSLLGVLKAGGAYVPLDPQAPESWQSCQLDMLLYSEPQFYDNAFADFLQGNPEVIGYQLDAPVIQQAIDCYATANPVLLETQSAFSLACVLFSDSTSNAAQGVMLEHGNIIRLVNQPNYLKILNGDVVAFGSEVNDPIAVFEIWACLANGGTLVHLAPQLKSSAAMLKQTINLKQVSIMYAPMPLISYLVQQQPDCFGGLQCLLFSGDPVVMTDINKILDGAKPNRLIQVFRLLENGVFSTWHEIHHRSESYPIGKPLTASSCYILDQQLQLLPVGEVGALYVGGLGLARGYLNDWQQTQACFLANPFADDPDDRIFNTGKQARYDSDGNIEITDHNIPQVPAELSDICKPNQPVVRHLGSLFYQPVWQSQPLSTLAKSPMLPDGQYLIFADNYGIGDRLVQRLRLASQYVVVVRVGQSFEALGQDEYLVDPQSLADHQQLLQQLQQCGFTQCHFIHLWSLTAVDMAAPCEAVFEQLARFERHQHKGLEHGSLLLQAVAESTLSMTQMSVITRQACSVTSDERLIPSAVCIGALTEFEDKVWQIDLSLNELPPTTDKINRLSQFIFAELTIIDKQPLVAYRGRQRWIPQTAQCCINDFNPTKVFTAAHILVITHSEQQSSVVLQQLANDYPSAKIIVLGPIAIAEQTGQVSGYPLPLTDGQQLTSVLPEIRQNIGQINGIVFCPAIDQPYHHNIAMLLYLDEALRNMPIEFCAVLCDKPQSMEGSVALRFYSAFIQNKHNRGTEHWQHVVFDTGAMQAENPWLVELLNMDKIPCLTCQITPSPNNR